jgi:regulatory protein
MDAAPAAMAMPSLSLKGRALRLLSGREHSRAELERKLAVHAQEPGELSRALDELQAKGFISAQRVVESVVHRRAPRLGAARIRHELQQKGLESALVQEAVAKLQASELDRARDVWRRKFGVARSPGDDGDGNNMPPPSSAGDRARQMRFLASRGFDGDTIRRVLSGSRNDDDFAGADVPDG